MKDNLKNNTLKNNILKSNLKNNILKSNLKNNILKSNLKNNIFENNILKNNVKNTVKNNLNNNKTNIELNNNNNNFIKNRNIHIDKDKLFEPIGILDPEGFRNNPFTNEPYTNVYYNPEKELSKENPTYVSLSQKWSNYPMYGIREESFKTLYDNQVILVVSGTGSGKTVLTPKYLLHIFNYQGRIAITNPKRIPTKENALYAARCMDVKLGSFVGAKYRNSDKKDYSSKCKLIYATDGWILQKLQKDPMLSDLDAVIIDEAHERGIQIDLLLLTLKELLKKRPEFKLVIMSATVNESIFIDYFPKNKFKFGLINAGVRPNFPIEEFFLDKPVNKFDKYGCIISDKSSTNYINVAVNKVITILKEHEIGDILVFFPGKGDTSDGCTILHQKLEKLNKNLDKKIYCNILTSTTEKSVQDLLVDPSKYKESGIYTRKVVFSTEVAESSITIDGLDFIIDSGLVNNNIFSAEKNMTSLKKEYISKASHKQRKGRTGRTSPGTCFCLFTKDEYEKKFIEYAIPPILSEDISTILLRFLSDTNIISHIHYPIKYKKISNKINNTEPKELAHYLQEFIQPPPIESVILTVDRLVALGIIKVEKNIGKITDIGKAASVFDLIPEFGISLIAGYNYNCRDDIVNLISLIEILKYRMDGVFQKFKPSSKDNATKKREKAIYDNAINKWVNPLGDHFSLINIYNKFSSYQYNRVNRKTQEIITPKKGNAKEWCKENFINFRTLESVKEEARQIHKNFGKVIKIFRVTHPLNKPTHLFIDSKPEISRIPEENIIRALLKGMYINIIKKVDKKYINCFPESKTTAGLSRESLFAKNKGSVKYAFYSQLKDILGNKNYSIVSKISPEIIKELMNSEEGTYVQKCLK